MRGRRLGHPRHRSGLRGRSQYLLHWLVEAAEHLRAFSRYCLCEVPGKQVHLDALSAVLREVKDGDLSEAEAIKRLERSSSWVWTAMDPASTRLVVIDGGTRTLAMAQYVVHHLVQVVAPGCVPLFVTDGRKAYGTALLSHDGDWMQPERRHERGPMPTPRWRALPPLRYAHVVKTMRRQRIVEGKHRVVFGTMERVTAVLSAGAWQINTACVERLNLDMRQRVAAVGRRVHTLCQGESGVLDQLAVFHTYHNVVLPHAS